LGAVKGAVKSAPLDFAAAVAAIVSLPLTEREKAQAIRWLLAVHPSPTQTKS
jgi:hypothetical protein